MYKFQDLTNSVNIPASTKVIFVSDLYVEDYVGGAELTTEALIESCDLEHIKLKSSKVTLEHLRQGIDKHWVFGNFSQLDFNLIPSIVANLSYSVLEYDYKFCKYRSPEKHLFETKSPCDCHNDMHGKLVSAFFFGAKTLFWMSEKQQEKYVSLFPFLAQKDNIILSSVFNDKTLVMLKLLREEAKNKEKKGWIVLGSSSWIKGFSKATQWCVDNKKEHEVVWNLPYFELLQKLSRSEGHVYLPEGADTCPRLTIEAKLLGLKLELNDNVQHVTEEWFNTDDLEVIEQYLYGSKKMFRNMIQKHVDYKPTVSGYMTTYNCIQQSYPFEQCIKSMLQFCNEVCIVDGGSTDGTLDVLKQINRDHATVLSGSYTETDGFINEGQVKVKIIPHDSSHPLHAALDGMKKAEARKMCSSEFCWQMDSDEVVDESDVTKIKNIIKKFPNNVDILALPVVEFWGSYDKVRLDVTQWKWRLSRNKLNITHGIPKQFIAYKKDGSMYALPGTDGCDMINVETREPLPFITFWSKDLEELRIKALRNDVSAQGSIQEKMEKIWQDLPVIFHYSWLDIARKIRLYRDFWQNHWLSLYNKDTSDTSENNMFFDVAWSDVTDEMIANKAQELASKTGGWIFHSRWNGQDIFSLKLSRNSPRLDQTTKKDEK